MQSRDRSVSGWLEKAGQRTRMLGLIVAALCLPVPARAQVTAYAVVPSWTNSRVTMLDAYTGATIAAIVAAGEPYDAAVTPDGRYAYITRRAADDVVVIDLGTKAFVAAIPLGGEPRGVAISPDGARAFVTRRGSHRVSVIDTASNSVVFSYFSSRHPWGLAIAPDGSRTYVVNRATSLVSVLDNTTNTLIGSVDVDREPVEIAIAPDGDRAYVSSTIDNTVVPIKLPSLTVMPSIPVGLFPRDLKVTPDGARIFVANSNSDTVSVIDAATQTVTATLPTTANSIPSGVAITPDGTRVLIGNQAGYVRFHDAKTYASLLIRPVGGQALRLTITPNLIVPAAIPLAIASDDDLTAHAFCDYITFNGGVLQATGDWATRRRVSLLMAGGTIDTQGFDVDIAADVVNNGALVKEGPGTLTLGGVSTHAGSIVKEGTLNITGRHPAPITLGSAGTLAGTGAVGVVDAAEGAISPGGSATATLRAEAITMGSALEFLVDIDGGTGASDRLEASKGAVLDGAVLTVRLAGDKPKAGQTFLIVTNAKGMFARLGEGDTVNTVFGAFRITYAGGPHRRDVILTALE
jgi:YVTN family beta-propeller protein/autotransporter-associated beta strand protein